MKITQDVFIHVGALAGIPYYWWIIGAVVIVALIALGVVLFRKKKGGQGAPTGGMVATKTSVLSFILAFVLVFSMTGISQAFADDGADDAGSYDAIHLYLSEDNELQGYSANATTDVLKMFSDYPDNTVHALVTGLDDNINLSIVAGDNEIGLCDVCTPITSNGNVSNSNASSVGEDSGDQSANDGGDSSDDNQNIVVSANSDDSTDPGTYQAQIEYHVDDGTETDISNYVPGNRDYANWMAGLPNNMPVGRMTLPGAHDTACWMDNLTIMLNVNDEDETEANVSDIDLSQVVFEDEKMDDYPTTDDGADTSDGQDDSDNATDDGQGGSDDATADGQDGSDDATDDGQDGSDDPTIVGDDPNLIHAIKALATTQHNTHLDAFNAGARVFDLRTYYSNMHKDVLGAHGANKDRTKSPLWFSQGTRFKRVIDDLATALKNHPTEFIIIRIAAERDIGSKQFDHYKTIVEKAVTDHSNVFMNSSNVNVNTPLSELRGKLLICPTHMENKGNIYPGPDPLLAYGRRISTSADGSQIGFFKYLTFPGSTDTSKDMTAVFNNVNNHPDGFGFTEINKPCTSMDDSPIGYAQSQVPLTITVTKSIIDGTDPNKPLCFGVVMLDFMSLDYKDRDPDGKLTVIPGASCTQLLIELNFRGH